MLFEKMLRFIKGYMVISVSGKFPERFLNVCANKGIFLSNATYLSENSVRVTISRNAYKYLSAIEEKTACRTEVLYEGGFPLLFKKYKKRVLLIFGPFMFVLSLVIMNCFVWEVEIAGSEKVSTKIIRENLETLGVKPGAFRFSIDQRYVKNEMLKKMPELSWIWVDSNSSKVIVNVRESVQKPDIYNYGDYCNIVAAKDGIISSSVVRSGTVLFDVGDTVLENDILVSGLMLSERGIEPRFLQSEAEIYARVWYEKTKKFELFEEKKTETGRESKKRRVKAFGFEFTPFWYKNNEFNEYTTETEVNKISIPGLSLGVEITTERYKEIKTEKIPLSEETVLDAGVKEILAEIEEETATGATLTEHSFSHIKNDDNTITVTVVSEFNENIAKKVRVE